MYRCTKRRIGGRRRALARARLTRMSDNVTDPKALRSSWCFIRTVTEIYVSPYIIPLRPASLPVACSQRRKRYADIVSQIRIAGTRETPFLMYCLIR